MFGAQGLSLVLEDSGPGALMSPGRVYEGEASLGAGSLCGPG